jgi:hypothetical protein
MSGIEVENEHYIRSGEDRRVRQERRHNIVPVGYDQRSGYERRRGRDRRVDADTARFQDELREKFKKLLNIDIFKGIR